MEEIEKEVLEYLKERKWDALRPGDLAKSVSIEASELLEIFQWDNPSLEDVKGDPERIAKIKNELADVLIYCLDISTLLGLDTAALIREKLERIRGKYPVDLLDGEVPGTANYWKIKAEHRKNADV